MPAQGQSLEVAVELERARRLGDRFGCDTSDDGELARERRAHQLSAQFLKEGATASNLLLGGEQQLDGVAKLELELEKQRRDRLLALTASQPQHANGDGAGPSSLPAPSPSSQALRDTLDEISVKSILDFRTSGSGIRAAEATATAAACAVANLDESVKLCITDLDPEVPWPDALQLFGKPGHFITTLRKFPLAVSAGKVPEDNIVAARHFLSMADEGDSHPVHPAVFGIQRWVASAIDYWEEASSPAHQSSAVTGTVTAASGSQSSPQQSGGGYQVRDFRPVQRSSPVAPVGSFSEARRTVASSPRPQNRQARGAASPRPARPAWGVATPVPKASPSGAGSGGAATRAGRMPATAPSRQQASPQLLTAERQPVNSAASTASATSSSSRTAAALRRTASPDLRQRPNSRLSSPRPEAQSGTRALPRAHTPGRQSAASSSSAAQPRPRSARRPAAAQPAPSTVACASAGRSQSRPRASDRGERPAALSPTRYRPGGAVGSRSLVPSKSASTLSRASPASPGLPSPTAEMPSVEELKRMIEETKKEVREIRSVEAKTKWQMSREDRREKAAEAAAEQNDLRDWRWKQAEGMKAYAAEKALEARATDLKESKDFVEFKREVKTRTREEELLMQQEVYEEHKEISAWTVERAREEYEAHQALIREKVVDVHELREEKERQREEEKMLADQDRALKEQLEFASMARELAREKERLMQSLQHTRSCLQAPPRRSR